MRRHTISVEVVGAVALCCMALAPSGIPPPLERDATVAMATCIQLVAIAWMEVTAIRPSAAARLHRRPCPAHLVQVVTVPVFKTTPPRRYPPTRLAATPTPAPAPVPVPAPPPDSVSARSTHVYNPHRSNPPAIYTCRLNNPSPPHPLLLAALLANGMDSRVPTAAFRFAASRMTLRACAPSLFLPH